jgi:hypothetical protein
LQFGISFRFAPRLRTAGARNVLVRLWKLNDGEPRDFMVALYKTCWARPAATLPRRCGRPSSPGSNRTPSEIHAPGHRTYSWSEDAKPLMAMPSRHCSFRFAARTIL